MTLCSFLVFYSLSMTNKYITPAVVGSFAIAYVCDQIISDKKIFGGKLWLSCWSFIIFLVQLLGYIFSFPFNDNPGTIPQTVATKDWWEETDKKFQAWPRTAGPPVVMNPITRQNFIVKSREWRCSCSSDLPIMCFLVWLWY